MSILKKILSLLGISGKEESAKPSIKPEPDGVKEFERYKEKEKPLKKKSSKPSKPKKTKKSKKKKKK